LDDSFSKWSVSISSVSTHSAVSPFKWSRRTTIISRWRLAAILAGRFFSGWAAITVDGAVVRWQSLEWLRALFTDAWYNPHTEQQRLLRWGSTDGQCKSYGGTTKFPIFCWITLFSWTFTNSGKKIGTSALDLTMACPLCFTGTRFGRNRPVSRCRNELLHGEQQSTSLQRTTCKQYCDSRTCAAVHFCDTAAGTLNASTLLQDYGLDDVISAVYTPLPLVISRHQWGTPLDDDVICGCPLSRVWSIQWFRFQWPRVTLNLDFKVTV